MVAPTIPPFARPRVVALLWLMCALLIPVSHSFAQKKGKEDMEQFEDVCPYTKGDRELEKKLGYERMGFVTWRDGEDSTIIQENMGAIPMLWVETEHFKIGSSLGTFKIDNNKAQKARIKEEIARLKKKLGKFKAPKKSLDPYLRLHVYAQRAEDIYAQFVEDFGIKPENMPENAQFLGHENKFLLLLCQRKSEYGRYIKTYDKAEHPFCYRMGWYNDGMIVALNMESISLPHDDKELPVDVMMHCLLGNTLGSCFIDGWEQNMFRAPPWITYGIAHLYGKRVDPHWTFFDARRASQINYKDAWNWEPRVRGLVKNEYFPTTKEMMTWTTFGDLDNRKHMISWSKMQYLLEVAKGDKAKFLSLACKRLTIPELNGAKHAEEPFLRQQRALKEGFGLTPDELDEAWAAWVSKKYKKK
jgi:hypothetical protein